MIRCADTFAGVLRGRIDRAPDVWNEAFGLLIIRRRGCRHICTEIAWTVGGHPQIVRYICTAVRPRGTEVEG